MVCTKTVITVLSTIHSFSLILALSKDWSIKISFDYNPFCFHNLISYNLKKMGPFYELELYSGLYNGF